MAPAPESFDAIVIGSGLGGSTAGALFAHAGYRVLVLERNHSFGGAATTYHRGHMTIEASLHETTDPRRGSDLKGEVFDALGLYEDVEFVPVGDFYEVRGPLVGDPLTIPHGYHAVIASLSERFPNDTHAIEAFFKRIDAIMTAVTVFTDKHEGKWWLAHGAELPLKLWPVVRDLRSSLSTVLDRHFGTNEALKVAVAANLMYYADDPDEMWWLTFVVAQGGYLATGGNYIKGGSQTLTDQLIARISGAGGEARAGANVVEVLLDAHRNATGVRYEPTGGGDAVTVRAPVVFANAAPHAVEAMLPEVVRSEFMAPYRDKPVSTSLFSVTLGVNRRPAELGVTSYSTVLVPAWVTHLADYKHCAALLADAPSERLPVLGVCDHSRLDDPIDGELFTLNVVGVDRLTNWDRLDDTAYQAHRNAWLEAIIAALDTEWPGLAEAVEQTDMATAKTMHEFLNTPGGAVYGFAPNAPEGLPRGGPLGSPTTTVPGLWLASAYSGVGGFTGAIGGGAAAARAALSHLYN